MKKLTRRSLIGTVIALALSAMSASSVAVAAETFVPAFSFSGPGSDPGLLVSPARMAVEPSTGNVFVADSGNGRVQVFDSSGGFLTEFGSAELDAPFGVAVRDVLGETVVYVSDPGTGQIVRFESDELLAPSFAVDAGFVSPLGGGAAGKLGSFRSPLAVDPVSGELLVGDVGKDVVQRYDAAGSFLGDFDGSGSPDGAFSHLEDLAVDQSGAVFVVDAQGGSAADGSPSRVDRFSAAGVHQAVVRPLGVTGAGLVAVDPGSSSVLVGDVRACFSCAGQPAIEVLDDATYEERATAPVPGTVTLTGLAIDSGRGRLYASVDDPCAGGCGHVGVHALDATELWTAAIDAPANVGQTTVDLSGTVDPKGNTTTARFEVSTDGGASWQTTPDYAGDVSVCTVGDPPGETCTTPVAVSQSVTGLAHDTGYQVRLKALAANGAASVVSPVESFTTGAIAPPAVTVEPAAGVSGDSADLSGTVDVQGFDGGWRFETSTDGGASWTAVDPDQDGDEQIAGGELGPQPVAQQLAGLQPNRTYQLRLVATNPGGETIEDAPAFTTATLAPEAAAGTVGAITETSARLTAYVDANNTATTYRFEYSIHPDLSSAVVVPANAAGDAGAGDGPNTVYQDVANLTPDTTYHWRVTAENAHGTDTDQAPRSFATWPTPPPHAGGSGANGTRRLELVSSGLENFGAVGGILSSDGNRALFKGIVASDESPYAGPNPELRARRTPQGWKVSGTLPPRDAIDFPLVEILSASPDLEHLTLHGRQRFGDSGSRRRYRYTPETGQLIRGADLTARLSNMAEHGVSSDDQRRDFAQADAGGSNQVYEVGMSQTPVEVGLLPGDVAPACGVSDFAFQQDPVATRFVSSGGDRVFFASRGDDCGGPAFLYMRQAGPGGELGAGTGATTTLISGPSLGSGDRDSEFVQATADGSRAFYRTASRLTSEDTNSTADIYLWTAGAGNECVTCLVSGQEADVVQYGMLPAVSAERLYFLSLKALAPGARSGEMNLYVWRASSPGRVALVAAGANALIKPGATLPGKVTRDGAVLAFLSDSPRLDALAGRPNGGQLQRYRYDDRDGSLVCVSCPTHTPTAPMEPFLSYEVMFSHNTPVALDEEGRSFFFETREPLLAADVNNGEDIYEWRDGRVALITDGRTPFSESTHLALLSIGAGGRDVLFLAKAALTPDALDSVGQLYDARVGGGFAAAEGDRQVCGGDDCQSRSGPPAVSGVGSGSLVGSGDLVGGRRPSLRLGGLSAGQRAALARGRSVVLAVRVNRPGRVSVVGRARLRSRSVVVARGSGRAVRAGTVRVRLRLSRPARRAVVKRRRLGVELAVSFAGVGERRSLVLSLAGKGR